MVSYLREALDVFGAEDPISVDAAAMRGELLELFRTDQAPDPGAVATLKAHAEELRRRYAEAAVAGHERDRLDGAGDERKRRILEGSAYADLGQLSAIELLPGGKYAGLQQKLADLRTCKAFDPVLLTRSVTCSECGYRPRLAGGPTAQALLGQIEEQISNLRTEWQSALADSIAAPEIAEQVDLLNASDKSLVNAFLASAQLPEPATADFVRAVSQVLTRFEVRRVAADEVWSALFPEAAPATTDELLERFRSLLDHLSDGATPDRLRIVPTEETHP